MEEEQVISSLQGLHFVEEQQERKPKKNSWIRHWRPIPPPSLTEVEEIIGYHFKNKELLREAFTHGSCKEENSFSYERLEYLGDSVLNHLIAKLHFTLYKKMLPGELTRLRAANVDTEALARAALKCNLHSYIRHRKPLLNGKIQEFINEIVEYPLHSYGMIDPPKVLADIIESLIGAIFVDVDYSMEDTWKVVNRLLHPLITPENLMKNPVAKLNEACNKFRLKPRTKDLWTEIGQIEIYVNDELIGKGKCKLKKIVAINRAADDAYNNLFEKVGNKETLKPHLSCSTKHAKRKERKELAT
ncbi:ribonuclease 3-like protein 3 [Bidens hawaiensis]|uniref:ribonuclease 3-like protein 3 n=1 Tax=Bidens hawaiensis TaxID=980011 RepID=UPI00404A9A7E